MLGTTAPPSSSVFMALRLFISSSSFFWVFVGGWGLGPHLPTILLLASCDMREVCLGFCISTHVIWRSLVKPNTSVERHQHREARRPDMPNPKRLMVMDAGASICRFKRFHTITSQKHQRTGAPAQRTRGKRTRRLGPNTSECFCCGRSIGPIVGP